MSYERDYSNDWDDWIDAGSPIDQGVPSPIQYPQPGPAPSRPGPPYTLHNPPPPPPGPGLEYRLNPATGQLELHVQGGDDNPTMTGAARALAEWAAGQRRPPNSIDDRVLPNRSFQLGPRPNLRSLDSLWPPWNPPQFSGMTYTPPPDFKYADFAYDDFKAPTITEAESEPGYAFAANQGRKQVEATKAAQGVYRSGQTLKDLYSWASEYAKQNYGGAFERKLQTYGTNRNNAFQNYSSNRNNAAENYMTNYGVGRDTFDRNYNVSRDVYDRGYNAYQGGFDSQRRRAELDFARDWDLYEADLDTRKFLVNAGNDR